MRPRIMFAVTALVLAVGVSIGSSATAAAPRLHQSLPSGKIHRATLKVPGGTEQMPLPTHLVPLPEGVRLAAGGATNGPVATTGSLGCRNRNLGVDVRVNQDCTYRRQAEEGIAVNPTDPNNLVAGMNDSIVGWNKTSLAFSLDGGTHWGSISTAPFSYRLNAPNELLPTAADPNRHTIRGGRGTLHSYDACSDPYLAYDSRGRAFYTCIGFDIASNASIVFVVPSPASAKGSYFDQVYPPLGLIPGRTGREHVVDEENSLAASSDGPKVAADAYAHSPNRDNVYSTWTSFDFTCSSGFCQAQIYGSMSTDHGKTWSTPQVINGRNSAICSNGDAFDPHLPADACNNNGHSDVRVLPNGDVVVTMLNANTNSPNPQILAVHCRPQGSSPAGTANLRCGRPTRAAMENVAHSPRCDFGRGPEQCSPGAFIRVPMETSQRLAVDRRTGALYVTWYDYRFGEFDIFVSRSADGGATWSAPRKVNPDRGTDHYFSAIDVASGSTTRLGISYARTGRVPHENTTPSGGFALGQPGVGQKLSDYVLAGGATTGTSPFVASVIAPNTPAPDGVQGGFNGDYTGIAIDPHGVAHPIWSDTRNAVPNPAFNLARHDEDVFTIRRGLPH